MQAITLAYSYVLEPVSSKASSGRRTFFSCLFFVIATVAGWPFVGVLALPFAFEELSLYGDDEVMPASRPGWAASRFNRLFVCGLGCLILISAPLVLVDWLAYGKLLFVPLNIVLYNVFPEKFGSGGGPQLYGTEPPHFYLLNLLLNFNIVFILALLAIPLVLLTSRFSKNRSVRLGQKIRLANQTPSAQLLIIRLVPVYAWIALMSKQPHKEERFMQPIYTLISFNAAVSLSLIRGWMEDIFVHLTSSPYRASIFPHHTLSSFSLAHKDVLFTSSTGRTNEHLFYVYTNGDLD
jgi:alpha-1,2-mannosyltransferase